jgi:hypothetical protein
MRCPDMGMDKTSVIYNWQLEVRRDWITRDSRVHPLVLLTNYKEILV